jgi:hypothetical protein
MHVQTHRWTKHTLEGHEPYEITPGERIFVTPGALLYAQLSIFISYQPWILPIHLSEKEFRFETRRLSDGKIEWLHIPADAEGENTGKEKLMHTILTWAGALVAIGAAIFWVISATVWVPSVGTAGWGALTGGFLVVPGPKKERIDLVETLRRQWGWNKWAAIATATAAVLTAGASLF